jgi:hypothetical protein
MKKVLRNSIINIENTDLFDNRFLFDYLIPDLNNTSIEIIYLSDLLEVKKNTLVIEKIKDKPSMY